MKTLVIVIFSVYATLAASAQITPGLYGDQLKNFTPHLFKADTTLGKIGQLNPGRFNGGNLNSEVNILKGIDPDWMRKNVQTIYSRMPVAHLNSDDPMPVAKLNALIGNMPTELFKVIDPIKPAITAKLTP